MKKYVYKYDLKTLYYFIVYSHLTYGIEAWWAANKSIINNSEVAQKEVIRCIESAHYLAHSSPMFNRLHRLKIPDLHELYTAKQMHLYNIDSLPAPPPLRNYLLETDTTIPKKLGRGPYLV